MESIRAIYARTLLDSDPDDLWDLLEDGRFKLVFDDGEIITNTRVTLLSSYCWWAHREWRNTPLLVSHHIGNSALTAAKISEVMASCSNAAMDHNPNCIDIEHVMLRCRQELNHMRNTTNNRVGSWVGSMDADDIVDLLLHPEIAAANAEIQSIDFSTQSALMNAQRYIEKARGRIRAVLVDPTQAPTNRLAECIRNKSLNISQGLQRLGPKGMVTDYDSVVFKRPLVKGFGAGLGDLYEVTTESRSATEALMLTKDPLAETEYFNREMQLICAVISKLIHSHDCGSTNYIPWMVSRNNLPTIEGAYYRNDQGTLSVVTLKDTHLIGKVIPLRDAMTCIHPDPSAVCEICYGKLARNIPRGTNIGHTAAVEVCSSVSQGVLSKKHDNMVKELGGNALFNTRYIVPGEGMYELFLSEKISGIKTYLEIDKDDIVNLADINLSANIDSLSPSKVSSMTEVMFHLVYPDGDVESNIVSVSTGSRRASFTNQFLKYMKENSWEMTEGMNVKIDLSNWKRDLPLWSLPHRNADMMEFMGSVQALVKVSGKNKSKKLMDLGDEGNMGLALAEFHELVSEKFFMNRTHLSVILRATMIRSSADNDYRLPIPGTKVEFGSFKQIMGMRSLSAMCAYQEQTGMFKNMLSFLIKKRTPSPFDTILMPGD
jgi:hypothetical protein